MKNGKGIKVISNAIYIGASGWLRISDPFYNRLNEIDHYMADDLMFAVMKWLNIA